MKPGTRNFLNKLGAWECEVLKFMSSLNKDILEWSMRTMFNLANIPLHVCMCDWYPAYFPLAAILGLLFKKLCEICLVFPFLLV